MFAIRKRGGGNHYLPFFVGRSKGELKTMKNKGFTLIELLAVIIILGIIGMIAVPIVISYIEDAKDGSLKASVRNIIRVAETTYTKKLGNNYGATPTITFEELEYQGQEIAPENVRLSFNEDGLAIIAVYEQSRCIYKNPTDQDVILDQTLSKEECMEKVGNSSMETGVELLLSKANGSNITSYTLGNTGELYTFTHPATAQTSTLTDYRYIGNVPNNYFTFNNETWRIIGVFDGRIKIIKDTSIGNLSWDNKQNGVGSSTSSVGSNDWTDSQLMYMLNGASASLKSGYTNDGTYIRDASNNIIYQLGCNPASASGSSYTCATSSWSLNETALFQIDTVIWYLGGSASDSHSAETYYTFERGTTVYDSSRSTNFQGKVGLMYPSDYAYTYAYGVDNTCYTDTYNCRDANGGNPSLGWLFNNDYQWILSPNSDHANSVFRVRYAGYVSNNDANVQYGVRPTVYLKSDIKLTGSGTSSDPYKIIE